MIDAKGVADTVLKGSAKKPEEEESDPLETAVSEFFDATDPAARAAAFKAAFAMCQNSEEPEE